MVISQIIGGLGNQMFQYAAARAVSIRTGGRLRLDISGFANYPLHQGFELQKIFNFTPEIATRQDVQQTLGWQSNPLVQRLVLRSNMARLRRNSLVVEPHFNYWQGINLLSKNSYLVGYWQSEKYFADVAQQIRADFLFRLPMSSLNVIAEKKILAVNAVSLHVRRGDYVNNAKTTATHGVCSLDYYREAIDCTSRRVNAPHFFVFSDDIGWVKDNLKIDYPHQYITHNQGAESYNDMRLMSMCQHHIIANSSFSWWGAWLNPDDKKCVIAPKRWFANDTNTQDLIPQNWLRL
ncbi:MAG: alpha-1,2-fucosyltransferase [Gallionella sp.]|nr:alpha-1,2-fucosyltransferase [Gallionella sp.]MDD4957803.1 alpha-1,2-fucosyltransferase [Gallionella sp.]